MGAARLQRYDLIPAPGARRLAAQQAAPADLVHASLSFSALDPWLATGAGRQDRPALATWHGPFAPGPRWQARGYRLWQVCYGRLVLRRFQRVIVFSEAHARWLEQRGILAPGQAVVLPNAVQTTFWRPDPAQRPTSGYEALYVGRLDRDKRPDLLCQLWARVAPATWRLRLVGDGELAGSLRRQWGHDPRFALPGPIGDRAALRSAYQAATLFLLPSPYEGQSLAVLEAMASGCAVLTTAAGGVAEAVGNAGVVLGPQADPDGFAEAMASLFADPHRCRQLGAAARARAVAHFDLEVALARLLALYHELLSRRSLCG